MTEETLAERLRRLAHDLTGKLSVVIMALESTRVRRDADLIAAAKASAREALGLAQQLPGLATMAEAARTHVESDP